MNRQVYHASEHESTTLHQGFWNLGRPEPSVQHTRGRHGRRHHGIAAENSGAAAEAPSWF